MNITQVRKYALSLPETSEEPHFHYASFRVRGKIFVTVPPEATHIHVFVSDKHREPALAVHSEYIEKLTWGDKVVGLRITLASAAQDVAKELIRHAWEGKAPRHLVTEATKPK